MGSCLSAGVALPCRPAPWGGAVSGPASLACGRPRASTPRGTTAPRRSACRLSLFIAGVAAARVQPSLRPYLMAGAFLTLLVVINWFRLAILALTSFYQPGVFEVVHIYVIQGVLIFAVGLLFMLWLSRVDIEATPLEVARADAQSS